VPFGLVQTVPQLPQAWRSVVRAVSQPFWGLPSQSPETPAVQLGRQTPCEHAVLPCEVVQARSQLPQLEISLVVEVSQPFCIVPSQLA
jgi:hypothetical protein